MGWKTAVDNCTDEKLKLELDMKYQQKSALLQKQNKAYNDYCELNGLKKRADRIQIAKWDREQAAAARGAARRYNNALDLEKRRGIIKQRISTGEYNLTLSKQQYFKHKEGTRQYDDYARTRLEKGKTVQNRLSISEEEAQSFINQYSGGGVPKTTRNAEVLNVEFVTGDSVIGQYIKNGTWVDTKRAAIHYGKKGTHMVPVEDKND